LSRERTGGPEIPQLDGGGSGRGSGGGGLLTAAAAAAAAASVFSWPVSIN